MTERPLLALSDLEYRLGESREKLRSLAQNWREEYQPFSMRRATKPFQTAPASKKVRSIDNPSPDLKRVQRKILVRLLQPITLPNFLFGAVPKLCIVKHAAAHVRPLRYADCMVKMDVQSYYPSVTARHVYKLFVDYLHCSPEIASLLTSLTTYKWRLPQGAPTSPALANLYLASIYSPVLEACARLDVVPTAWVDDLVFSGSNAREVMELVRSTLSANGLKIAKKKVFILGRMKSKETCGVRVGKSRVRATKDKLRDLRAAVHKIEIGTIPGPNLEAYVLQTRSRINHVARICKKDALPLQERLERALLPGG